MHGLDDGRGRGATMVGVTCVSHLIFRAESMHKRPTFVYSLLLSYHPLQKGFSKRDVDIFYVLSESSSFLK